MKSTTSYPQNFFPFPTKRGWCFLLSFFLFFFLVFFFFNCSVPPSKNQREFSQQTKQSLPQKIDNSRVDSFFYKTYQEALALERKEDLKNAKVKYKILVEKIQQQAPIPDSLKANVYNNLALVCDVLGFNLPVQDYFDKALAYWRNAGAAYFPSRMIVLNNLIAYHSEYGNEVLANNYLQEMRREIQAFGKEQNKPDQEDLTTTFLHNQCRYFALAGKEDSLWNAFQQIKLFCAQFDQKDARYDGHFAKFFSSAGEVGYFFKKTKKFDQAESVYKELFEFPLHEGRQLFAHANLAVLFYDQKKYDQSFQHTQSAIAAFPLPTTSQSFYILHLLKALNLQALGQSSAAIPLVDSLMALLAEKDPPTYTTSSIRKQDFETKVSARYISFFEKSGALWWQQYQDQLERSALLNAYKCYELAAALFSSYYNQDHYNQLLSETANKIEDGLLRCLITMNAKGFIAAEEYQKMLFEALASLENNSSRHLWKRILRNYVRDAAVDSLEAAQPITVQFLQKKARSSQALLRYVWGQEFVYLFLLQSDSIYLTKLGNVEEVGRKVNLAQQLFREPQTKLELEHMNFRFFVPSDIPDPRSGNWTVVPDGPISALPFEALVQPEQQNRYLAEEYSIRYVYSLKQIEIEDVGRGIFEQSNRGMHAGVGLFLPSYPLNQKLLFGQQEAQEILQLVEGDLYTGQEASVGSFLALSSRYAQHHLAAHARLDTLDYEQSALLFSNGEPLPFYALYKRYFPSRLTVLAACNSGMGSYQTGEGIMSLSRALQYAGVHAVVHTLWAVPDKESAELMRNFYFFLRQGKTKSVSLMLAKKKFRDEHLLKSAPYYWAAFVVAGEDRPVYPAQYPAGWLFLIFPALSAAAFLFWSTKYRR